MTAVTCEEALHVDTNSRTSSAAAAAAVPDTAAGDGIPRVPLNPYCFAFLAIALQLLTLQQGTQRGSREDSMKRLQYGCLMTGKRE